MGLAGSPRPGWKRARRRHYVAVPLLVILLAAPCAAVAQVSGAITVASDNRWRGRTLSAGRPVTSVALAYDAPGGAYADAVATAALTGDLRIFPISIALDAGYAWRTSTGIALDLGVTRQEFSRHASGGRRAGYSEVYAGFSGRVLAARLAYSPDYFAIGSHTLYGSVEAVARPAPQWRFLAHAGSIIYLSPIRVPNLRTVEYDASLGVARTVGNLELRLDLSTGGPDRDLYRGRAHSKTALVGSVSLAL